MRINRTQIYGDGVDFIIFFSEGESKQDYAYKFKEPSICDISISFSNSYGKIPTLFASESTLRQPTETTFKVEGVCKGGNEEVISAREGELLPKLDMFRNVKVSELFRIINKKLSKREK